MKVGIVIPLGFIDIKAFFFVVVPSIGDGQKMAFTAVFH